MLIPTAFAAVLVGISISSSVTSGDVYSKAEHFGRLSSAVVTLADNFTDERDFTAQYIAAGRPSSGKAALQAQYTKVDASVRQVRALAASIDSSYGVTQTTGVRVMVDRLDGIAAVRLFATDSKAPADTVIDKYTQSIGELLDLLDGTTAGVADDQLAGDGRSLGALARDMEEYSRQRAYLMIGLTVGSLPAAELSAVLNAQAQRSSEQALFQTSATADQFAFYSDVFTGPEIDQASLLEQQVITSASAQKGDKSKLPEATSQNLTAWTNNMAAGLARTRTVEQRLGADIVSRAKSKQDEALQSALVGAGIAILLFLLVLAVTFMMARSLVRPLRQLRRGALEIAGSRLPGLVERLRDPEAAAGGIEVAPIDIETTDEIGQVARAFDEVHREAVRLAANEAVLRGNINAMFVNLSRRSQSLIERQLRLIDDLEQGERDDDRLGSLFRLDHLATRMRRNCENLLVLGGQDQVRRWNRPVPLIDVVRASLSEVEQYERVQLRVQGEVAIAGAVVNDLVHLVAELVENAISFSPEHTPITVSGHLVSGGSVMVQITDQGVGMTPEELAEANERLAAPPVADVAAARRMGLFVVGRLASRHGIRVELRTTVAGGVTAFALLPERVVGGNTPQEAVPVGARANGNTSTTDSWSAFTPSSPPPPVPAQAGPTGRPQPIWRTAQEAMPQEAPVSAMPQTPVQAARSDLRRDPMLYNGRPPETFHSAQPVVETPARYDFGPQRGTENRPVEAMPYTEPKHPAETGPMPAISDPVGSTGPWGPVPNAGQTASGRPGGRSPIFEAMTSEWFQARPADEREQLPDPNVWRSAADEGWQTAEQRTRAPESSGRTSSGLPKRVPGQNRVPGAIPQSGPPGAAEPRRPAPDQPQPQRQRQAQPASPPPPPRDPGWDVSRPPADVMRNRFSGLQRGVYRGRTETTSGAWAPQADDHSETGEQP